MSWYHHIINQFQRKWRFVKVASHKVCKAESYSEIFEPLKAQKNFGNNFLVI